MEEFAYVRETDEDFESVVEKVVRIVKEKNWTLFNIYDIQERLRNKGYEIDKLKIIEICKASHAHKLIQKNRLISLCMPCKINIIKDGNVKIVGIKPSIMLNFFNDIQEDDLTGIEKELKEIIDLTAENK